MNAPTSNSGPSNRGRAVQALHPALLLAAFATTCASVAPRQVTSPGAQTSPYDQVLAAERHRIAVFQRACPSVVRVEALGVERDRSSANIREFPTGLGSGFVWDSDGHIVTNLHVIRGAAEARVSLKDGTSWVARVMGSDPSRDVAVLMVDAPTQLLEPVLLPSGARLQVGQTVLAIGNPFGFDHTLTVGVISAMGRELRSGPEPALRGLIQTDAAINPGSSGGPLLDSAGELAGMNTALASPSGAFAGIGFAVPVDAVRDSVSRILGAIAAQGASIGIRTAADAWLQELGLRGALVLEVAPGGPADRAGLRGTRTISDGILELGDLIVAIDGVEISSADELAQAIARRMQGERVSVTVRRGEQTFMRFLDVERELHLRGAP